MTDPVQFPRRSFIYRRLSEAGAAFAPFGDAAVATHFPGRGGLPARLALVDLSPLPRTGFKGRLALDRLQDQGLSVPSENNRATVQANGTLLLRLADTEGLLLGSIDHADTTFDELEATIPGEGCYAVPRRDSHAWFMLCGTKAVACLQKLCGADLRPRQFPDLTIAQTSVARLSAVVVRQDRENVPAFHLLADSAAALYLWDAVLDAAGEFFGGPAGLRALHDLGPKKSPTA